MNFNNKPSRRQQRAQSVILISDDDENDDKSKINNFIQTQYATPMAQIDEYDQVDTKPSISTTNQLQITTSSYSVSKSVVLKPEEIDLTSPMTSPCGLSQQNYLPYTLNSLNQERLSILPTYPPKNNNNQQPLLLANIPNNQLSEQERVRRRSGKYKSSFSIVDPDAFTRSFMVQQYKTYYGSILERFNVDLSILDYNYLRLKKFIQLCQLAYIRMLPSSRSAEFDFNINENEFPQLLEFYLQIDIDLFYMKTCSFRQKETRIVDDGLFCITTPKCRHVMEPCGNCALCYTFNQPNSHQQYSVTFNLYQKHRFVNGYESILNAPASCHTNNIIYALTCQCGNYDYIGETSDNLLKRLSSHRCFIHRLILERLVGEKNYVHFWGGKSGDMIRKDSMRLYQHPIHCPSAIQSFLNQNMDYWIFVPMPNKDADRENIHYQSVNSGPPLPPPSAAAAATAGTTTASVQYADSIRKCLATLPIPPTGYKFTNFQIRKQYEFFTMKHYQKQINHFYTVYNATMIAVLPLNTSEVFRRLIHSLFITHTEAKLNKLGHLFTYALNAPIYQHCWCFNLRHPRY